MIKIEKVSVYGLEEAIRGMRNPMNSWNYSDSYHNKEEYDSLNGQKYVGASNVDYCVGYNDNKLMINLASGGPVHAKYRRMITVYLDITAPLYWWKEFDTYKVGTVANSCSTMHKIHAKEFTLEDFSHEHLIGFGRLLSVKQSGIYRWRKEHKLNEWREFCRWIEQLPYSEIIIGKKEESDE